jgi:uncharacterized protein YcnI
MSSTCSGRAPRPPRRTARRLLGTTAAATALVLATALPAFAHVTVSSPDATPGGFGKLVFRVPTESATAATTKITVDLPETAPFASVSAMPLPGWTVSTTDRTLAEPVKDDDGFNITKAVATVTWTAKPGQGLAPGEFEEFQLSVGPFPDKAGSVRLPTTQTYSDGSVVTWDDPTPASGKEPEHPAPTLAVVAPATKTAAMGSSTRTTGDASSDDDPDLPARWLGGGGLVLGLLALVVALASRRRQQA